MVAFTATAATGTARLDLHVTPMAIALMVAFAATAATGTVSFDLHAISTSSLTAAIDAVHLLRNHTVCSLEQGKTQVGYVDTRVVFSGNTGFGRHVVLTKPTRFDIEGGQPAISSMEDAAPVQEVCSQSELEVATAACAIPALFVVKGRGKNQGIAYGTWGEPDFVCRLVHEPSCERAVNMRSAMRICQRLGIVVNLLGPRKLSVADQANYHPHQQSAGGRRDPEAQRCLKCGAVRPISLMKWPDECHRCELVTIGLGEVELTSFDVLRRRSNLEH